jgi:hypothetical protein
MELRDPRQPCVWEGDPVSPLSSINETPESVTLRIIQAWESSTPDHRSSGATWYDDGRRMISDLSDVSGHSPEHVAAVVAHLSPRTTWARNITGARGLLTTGVAEHCMSANVVRATDALASAAPLDTLRGPKTRRFALNLLGDRDAVTIDVWALRVALGTPDTPEVLRRQGMYEALESCYQDAARRVGTDPATVQACTWVAARNGRVG